jgi:hypothetical protein
MEYARRAGVEISMDGDQWCATGPGFDNLAVSPAGFGDTTIGAMAALATEIGYRPATMWGPTFRGLLDKMATP